MYLFLFLLFPVLLLFNSYLAMISLVAAIAGMYFQRTQSVKRPTQGRSVETEYKAGYE